MTTGFTILTRLLLPLPIGDKANQLGVLPSLIGDAWHYQANDRQCTVSTCARRTEF